MIKMQDVKKINKKKLLKNKKGITLIALVVTIVVLLVLARSKHLNANRR